MFGAWWTTQIVRLKLKQWHRRFSLRRPLSLFVAKRFMNVYALFCRTKYYKDRYSEVKLNNIMTFFPHQGYSQKKRAFRPPTIQVCVVKEFCQWVVWCYFLGLGHQQFYPLSLMYHHCKCQCSWSKENMRHLKIIQSFEYFSTTCVYCQALM